MAQIKGKRRVNKPKPPPKKKGSTATEAMSCNDKPDCQCYLRRGLFLPPGLDEVENRNDSADASGGKN